MNQDLKEKLEEAFELAVFDAYGDCQTIDGVGSWVGETYYYGGFISEGEDRLNPRGKSELKKDTDLKEMGISISQIETNKDEEYLRGEMDIYIYFTLNA
tara:strand:- start:117 stop:413 length:297 start_codon:yes stop_codon:yes gene_type:complete